MSSVSSVEVPLSSQQPTQLVSAPPSPHIYITKKLTSSQRLKQIRKLPEYDSRNIFGDPLQAYSQPDVLFEEKIRLTHDVENLLTEVVPLREQAGLIAKQFEDPDRDPMEEAEERELQQKISSFQDEIDEIDKKVALFKTIFTIENEEFMKGGIQDQRREKSDLESEIEELQDELNQALDDLEKMKNNSDIKTVNDNDDQIRDLQNLLIDLQNEEKDLLAEHEKKLSIAPTESKTKDILSPYIRKLQQVEHIRTKRSVELRKIQKNSEKQKLLMEAMKAEKLKKDRERKSREKWAESYKKRETISENTQKRLSQMQQGDGAEYQKQKYKYINSNNSNSNSNNTKMNSNNEPVEYETVIKITRRKHRHKHYHHKDDSSEQEMEKTKDPLMFSTEVMEDSLRISQTLTE